MRQAFCLFIALIASQLSNSATADEIVRWEDKDGVTQFSHPQFAPPQSSEPVEVMPVNSMAVPEGSRLTGKDRGPTVITLSRTKLQNKRGFRGFDQRTTNSRRN